MDAPAGLADAVDLVDNPSRAQRRFYMTTTLLLSLNQAYGHGPSKRHDDLCFGGDQEIEDLFFSFLCRLGQICDSRPNGATVTSFAALATPTGVQYVLASNRRRQVELETVKGYISSILLSLEHATEIEGDAAITEFLQSLLGDILIFNRDRIKAYIKGMISALEGCLAIMEKEDNHAQARQDEFRRLIELGNRAKDKDSDDDDYNQHTQNLIKNLGQFLQSGHTLAVMKRASADQTANVVPWRELRHCASRLVSYSRAVNTLWQVAFLFPELTRDFVVTPIASSTKQGNPLLGDSQPASDIISREVPNLEKDKYVRIASILQHTYNLDQKIKDQWESSLFRPIIHAELLVLNWIENEYGTKPEVFFKNWAYIGSSKPTCRLCHYYVSAQGSGVRVRNSHGNLYPNWRVPDRPDHFDYRDGENAIKKRQQIFQDLTSSVLREVLRALRERVAGTKPRDSDTFSSLIASTTQPGITVREMSGLINVAQQSVTQDHQDTIANDYDDGFTN